MNNDFLSQILTDIPVAARTKKLTNEFFLKGPVPMRWLEAASKLSPSAFKLGIYIWHIHGMRKSEAVKINLSSSQLHALGVTRSSASKALKDLASSGLVKVERTKGRASIVTLQSLPK